MAFGYHAPSGTDPHHTRMRTPSPSPFPGDDRDGSATDEREAEQRKAASSSSHAASRTPPENSHDLAPQSQGTTSEHFPGNLLDHASEFGCCCCCLNIFATPKEFFLTGPKNDLEMTKEGSAPARRGGRGGAAPGDACAEEAAPCRMSS